MRRLTARAVIVSTAVGLVAAGLSPLAGLSPSAGASTPAGTTSSTTSTTVSLHRDWSTWPAAHKHSTAGAIDLTEKGTLQRYANRSNSPRPATKTTASKRRVLAASPSPAWLPVVSPATVTTKTPGAVASWKGLNEYANGAFAGFSLEPPDQGLCAANGHVLELINDVVRVYGTTGSPQTPVAYLNDFFGEPGFQFTTDPSCVYDAGSNRFFASELTLDVDPDTGNLTGNNWLDLAVSKSGNPADGFNIYQINTTDDGSNGTPVHASCPCIGDFPHLATDANGVYLTSNEYPFSGPGEFGNGFNGAQIYALSKHVVVNGGSSVRVVHLSNVRVPSTSGDQQVGFTLWPAQTEGSGYPKANGGTQYFVSSLAAEEAQPDRFTGHAAQIGAWSLTNTSSLNARPNLSLHVKLLNVGSYGIPPTSNQKAGPVPLKDCLNVDCAGQGSDPYAPEQESTLDSSDTRPLTAVYANGSVYSALDTAMQVAGNVEAGFQWFNISTQASSPRVVKHGYFGVAHGNAIFPAIATDASGHGYISYTLSGDNWYPSAAYSTFSAGPGSAANIAGVGAAPEDGFCGYLFFNCAQTDTPAIRPRWGDYGYAAWDGSRFFVANEFIGHSCSYATFNNDPTCGATRTFYGNFSTHITQLH